jgi:tetratricopeptide (TPR) repeat protein
LQEALSMSTGASVFFIVTPPGEGKKREMERLSRLLSGWHILAVRLSPEQPLDPEALRGQLRALQGDRRPMIWVEVEGLGIAEAEPARSAVAEQARRVLQDLNLKREALERLDAPILFWVTPPELRAFSVWAADLFAARTAIIDLERLRPTAEKTLRIEMFLTADHPHSALPPAEVEGRIRLYEGALEAEARKRRPHLPRIASLHEELARLYARRGDLHSALRHQREGQNVYRELAQQHPEVFLPGLARSLNDLSVWLSELGRREEALQAAREAVDLFRRLAPQRPRPSSPTWPGAWGPTEASFWTWGAHRKPVRPSRRDCGSCSLSSARSPPPSGSWPPPCSRVTGGPAKRWGNPRCAAHPGDLPKPRHAGDRTGRPSRISSVNGGATRVDPSTDTGWPSAHARAGTNP